MWFKHSVAYWGFFVLGSVYSVRSLQGWTVPWGTRQGSGGIDKMEESGSQSPAIPPHPRKLPMVSVTLRPVSLQPEKVVVGLAHSRDAS